jgi:hypothetical protein
MIEVEMPDGTILEFPEGTPQETMVQQAQQYMQGMAQPAASEEPGFGQTLLEMGRSGAAGLARGAASLADLPGAFISGSQELAARGVEALGAPQLAAGMRAASEASIFRPDLARQGAEMLTAGGSEYRSPTTAGQFAGTVGEFIPGSSLGPGGVIRNLVMGAGAGLGSEAAGQLTEGTQFEPYARMAGAIAAPLAMGRVEGALRPIMSVDDEALRQANILRGQGVSPTAGQMAGSDTLRRMEGTVEPTARQLDNFTAAAMRSIGSDAPKATSAALAQAEKRIVDVMDDALSGVSITPSATVVQRAQSVAREYQRSAPAATVVPRVRNIVDEIDQAATAGRTIDLQTLREWRTALGQMTRSNDEATREAAQGLRRVIDNMTDVALSRAGRADKLSQLKTAREQYRNFLAVSDASTRAGAETGLLSATQLNQSLIRTQGRRQYATGRGTTPLAELTRAGASLLRPMSAVQAGGVRDIMTPAMAGIGAGGLGLASGLGPLGTAGAIMAGAIAPSIGQAAMRSAPIQGLLQTPAVTARNVAATIPGLLAQ